MARALRGLRWRKNGPQGSVTSNRTQYLNGVTRERKHMAERATQFTRLLAAIKDGDVYNGTGSNAANLCFPFHEDECSCVLDFVNGLIMAKGAYDGTSFDYIQHQIYPAAVDDEEDWRIYKEILCEEFGECKVNASGLHTQVHIPLGSEPPRKHRARGTYKVQAYSLGVISRSCATDLEFTEKLEDHIERAKRENMVAAHRCKKAGCMSGGHCSFATYSSNIKGHDVCGAYWVIAGRLVNTCICTSVATERCLYPGPKYNRDLHYNVINEIHQSLTVPQKL